MRGSYLSKWNGNVTGFRLLYRTYLLRGMLKRPSLLRSYAGCIYLGRSLNNHIWGRRPDVPFYSFICIISDTLKWFKEHRCIFSIRSVLALECVCTIYHMIQMRIVFHLLLNTGCSIVCNWKLEHGHQSLIIIVIVGRCNPRASIEASRRWLYFWGDSAAYYPPCASLDAARESIRISNRLIYNALPFWRYSFRRVCDWQIICVSKSDEWYPVH